MCSEEYKEQYSRAKRGCERSFRIERILNFVEMISHLAQYDLYNGLLRCVIGSKLE